MKKLLRALPVLAFASVASATALPTYPTPGTVNPADYAFTATASGTVVACSAARPRASPTCSASSSTASMSV